MYVGCVASAVPGGPLPSLWPCLGASGPVGLESVKSCCGEVGLGVDGHLIGD